MWMQEGIGPHDFCYTLNVILTYLHVQSTMDFVILARFVLTIYQSLYVKRKHLGKIDNSGKDDKYLNVYRYLDVSKLVNCFYAIGEDR